MTMRISVILPVQPLNIGAVLPFARLAARTSSERLWSGQSMGLETHTIFAALAGAGMNLEYGSAVTLMPLRHPYAAALTARSIASLSGRPYVSGIGPAAVSMQRRTLGEPYPSQLGATQEYLTIMRSLLDGKPTTSHGLWPVEEMGLPDAGAPPVELALGVLRPAMARLAGAVADRAITWLAPRNYIRDTLRPALAAGAATAGRRPPPVTSVLHCVLDRPGRDVVNVARMACELHMFAPHYVEMLATAGISLTAPDPLERARVLIDREVIVAGTAENIAGQVAAYAADGVDEVVLNLGGVYLAEGPGAAARDLATILDLTGGLR